ncbi:Uncharacterised protein [Halioglobus japonicus]|nr:Uncharacterised protein [Halioglobus japonicus]
MRLSKLAMIPVLLGLTINCAHASLVGMGADYNVFVFGDFTSSNSDTEGNLAAGGNVNLQNYSVATKISGNSARLVASGNVTASSGGVGNGQNGTIYTDGSSNLTSFTATGGISPQSLVDFSQAQSLAQTLSTSWGSLAANGSTSTNYGTLNLSGSDSALNVFTVSGGDLTNTNAVNIDVTAGSTVLINVTGSGQIFQNGQVTLTGIDAAHILYNFSESTALTLAGSKNPFGSLFAPFADVTGGYGALDGQLIAQSFSGNTEFHNSLFAGNLPSGTEVPVPATAWLFVSALVLLGSAGRKKRLL